eukprot:TRINITY_DN9234_c0_g1_i5.p2 TRINITY_DN9234_c0_g1~~TRINITY_DN9234_c0_g1_i5.p2  ORF type:complete len:121 (-),score=16.00 TRINITY_DN9234_c0_g1_i5:234-596(-)
MYGTGIPRSLIARTESSNASSSQGLRLRTDEEVEALLQSMKAAIREEVTNEVRAEMRAELRAELTKLEARLSQSRNPITSQFGCACLAIRVEVKSKLVENVTLSPLSSLDEKSTVGEVNL